MTDIMVLDLILNFTPQVQMRVYMLPRRTSVFDSLPLIGD